FVEPQILHRACNLTVLDEKGAIARETSIENRARIDRPNIPESGDEDSALGIGDHLFDAAVAATHAQRPDLRPRLDALLLRPITIVREIPHDAVLDPRGARRGQSLTREGVGVRLGIVRIGGERHALIDDLLADLVSAALLAEEAATLVG